MSSSSPSAAAVGVEARLLELSARFTDSSAEVAALLCDDHPAEAVALTVVDPSGATEVLTYADLADAPSAARVASAASESAAGSAWRQ